ncbi:Uu.00g142840.m01.CDS01 [Anthostomella pinea]|uniref:Uu.00g142840.m01.CDS01 n=1 Tax=Anthostomella pinea TaxID=933095 RepID=A0AAI8YLH2_9PEZI|nr:Uu.00g142840.m01.CDS01 [Anthostomella pinea]
MYFSTHLALATTTALTLLTTTATAQLTLSLPTGYSGHISISKAQYQSFAASKDITLPPLFDVVADPISITAGDGTCAADDPNRVAAFPDGSGITGDLCVPDGKIDFDIGVLQKRGWSCWADCAHLVWDEDVDAHDQCIDDCNNSAK